MANIFLFTWSGFLFQVFLLEVSFCIHINLVELWAALSPPWVSTISVMVLY